MAIIRYAIWITIQIATNTTLLNKSLSSLRTHFKNNPAFYVTYFLYFLLPQGYVSSII